MSRTEGVSQNNLDRGGLSRCQAIEEVEHRVHCLVHAAKRQIVEICLCLGDIRVGRLYRQAGYCDFSAYLAANRIDLPYKTAMNYSLIGSIMVQYRDELVEAGYDPLEHGINKLRLIAGPLHRKSLPKGDIFGTILRLSYRQLRRYLAEREASLHADTDLAGAYTVRVLEDCVTVRSHDREIEIAWVDSDAFASSHAYRVFMRKVAGAVEDCLGNICFDGRE